MICCLNIFDENSPQVFEIEIEVIITKNTKEMKAPNPCAKVLIKIRRLSTLELGELNLIFTSKSVKIENKVTIWKERE